MGNIIINLYNRYKRSDIVFHFIYGNILIFVLITFITLILSLLHYNNIVVSCFSFPASFNSFILRPWTIITYMFVHADVWHILFNMLCLYWFGKIFLLFFSAKHFYGVYFLGGIAGALLFMLFYNFFFFFRPFVQSSFIVGASASVLAIIIAVAYKKPDYRVQLFLFGNIKLKYMAFCVIIIDVMLITSSNAGGHIAHLGGAIAGLLFAISLQHGIDLTLWINKTCDAFSSLFTYIYPCKKKKMKIHYGKFNNKLFPQQRNDVEMNRIFDKIKKSGYQSLTVNEKKKLFEGSK